ncbi:hypothetical protein KR084_008515 [Drosophila pseudotakahashii]|nr:hypothetical protein KR084_008515 [Drosophila pseudotakahashii]
MENPRTIIDLPFEILDLVFKNLISLKCKVNLSQAHEKLGKAFAFHCRNKFRKLSTGSQLKPKMWAMLIRECGPTIEEYVYGNSGYSWNDTIADAVATHCPNLKAVSIVLYRSGRDGVPAFLIKVKNSLKSVQIDQQDCFTTSVLTVVSEFTQLTTLSFKGWMDETVYQIQNMVALEKLTIELHYYIVKPSVNLLRICAPLRNLKDLSVINIKIVPPDKPYSVTWVGLKSLSLICCELCTELPDCQELTYLDIDDLTCRMEGYILRFIHENGRNLKTLYESYYPPIKADDFLQLLRCCPKLRCFYTPMEYITLYMAYVSTIVEILEHNGVTRENPLELVITRRIKWKWFRRLVSTIK